MWRVHFCLILGLFFGLAFGCKQQGQERKKNNTPGQQGSQDATFTGATQVGGVQTKPPEETDLGSGDSSPEQEDEEENNEDSEENDVDTDTDLAGSEELDIETDEVTMSKRADLTITDYSDDNYEEGGTIHLALLDRDGDIIEEKATPWPAKGQTTVVKDMCNNLAVTELELKISGVDHDSPIPVGNKWIKRDNTGTDKEPRIIVEFQTGFLCMGDCVDDNKAGFKCPNHDLEIDGL